jgi:nucleotide-binding universal stress UspA family protein
MEKISHILIPVNGNPEDEVALLLASGIAKRNKAKVTVVHVVEVRRSLPVDAELPSETAHGEKVLDSVDEYARSLDVDVNVELLQARQAGPAIVDEASALNVGLIVMGLPYRNEFGSFQLGDTSNYILSHAHCRVWVVREKVADVVETGA